MDKINKLKINNSGWKVCKLGDIASEISVRVDNPAKSEYDRFVGLENFESGELKIRQWSATDSLTSSAKAFKTGDVLFARRNAYLRRASIVEFDGCCSGDAFVLRANNIDTVTGFLPFVMNSSELWDFANSNAAGTMSKRVKWQDLSEYEFLLPPKDQQAGLAELFWSLNSYIEKNILLLRQLNNSYSIFIDELFSKKSTKWSYLPLSGVAYINKNSLKSNTKKDYAFKYMDIASIIEPKVVGDMEYLTFSSAPSRARRIVKDNSIVLSLVRPYHRSFVFMEKAENIIASTGTAVLDAQNGFYAPFIFHQFFSKKFLTYCETKMSGTNYPAITPTDLADFEIAVPDNYGSQVELAKKLNLIDQSIGEVKKNIEISRKLLRSLINQIF